MKIQALVLLRIILAASFAQTVEAHVGALSKPLLDVLQERYYKVRSRRGAIWVVVARFRARASPCPCMTGGAAGAYTLSCCSGGPAGRG